jgi:hypothetical protein
MLSIPPSYLSLLDKLKSCVEAVGNKVIDVLCRSKVRGRGWKSGFTQRLHGHGRKGSEAYVAEPSAISI